jgi:predicted outer membrane protein
MGRQTPAGSERVNFEGSRLKSLKGTDFSSRYDSDQLSGHKDAVSLFERYAKGGENAIKWQLVL